MTAALNILVLESEPGAGANAASQLTAEGHRVHRCHEGATAFPCSSLSNDGCPLETATIDVALTVRSRDGADASAFEDGVSCALQHRVPLVVAGATSDHPYGAFASCVVSSEQDLPSVVTGAARGQLVEHEVLATQAAREVLARRGFDGIDLHVDARRNRGGVHVVIDVPTEVDQSTRSMVGVRVQSALGRYDRHARTIDVAVPV